MNCTVFEMPAWPVMVAVGVPGLTKAFATPACVIPSEHRGQSVVDSQSKVHILESKGPRCNVLPKKYCSAAAGGCRQQLTKGLVMLA